MKRARIIGAAAEKDSARLEDLLRRCDIITAGMVSTGDRSLKQLSKLYADVVVVFSPAPEDTEFAFMNKLNLEHPRFCTILITDTSDTSVFTKAMRCSVAAVLSRDVSPEELTQTINAELSRHRMRLGIKDNQAESGNVIAVFSTKGGTGKTTVAVNLAASLAKSGRRVALIDLDLQFGDVGVFMNISKSDTISDLIEEGDFSPDAVTGYLYKHSCGVHALCAPGSPEQADLITPEHIEAVISSVKNGYEYVILDLPPILDDNSIASIEQADHIWFITNPEISTLKNTKVCMDILRSLDLEDKIRIVLNKDGDAIISKDKVKSVLLSEIELSIPYDFKTAVTAVNRGKPFVISDPHAKVSKAFEKYVKSLDEAK